MAAAYPDIMSNALDPACHDWFALQVVARREVAIADVLREKGYDPFVPLLPEARQRKRRAPSALFPGYVFSRSTGLTSAKLFTTPGFIRIVGFGAAPAPIPCEEIESIRQAIASGCYLEPVPFLSEGDVVRVTAGPLAGVEGRLIRRASTSTLLLSITLLQRAVAVQVDASAVTRVVRGSAG